MKVQLRQAKAQLSELVKKVERGVEVVITRHGDSVATLVPVKKPTKAFRVNYRLLNIKKPLHSSHSFEEIVREDRDGRA